MRDAVVEPKVADDRVLVEFAGPVRITRALSIRVPNGFFAEILVGDHTAARIDRSDRTEPQRVAPLCRAELGKECYIAFVRRGVFPAVLWGFGQIPVRNEALREAFRAGANGQMTVEVTSVPRMAAGFGVLVPITGERIRDAVLPAFRSRGAGLLSDYFSGGLSLFDAAAQMDLLRQKMADAFLREPIFKELGLMPRELTVAGIHVDDADFEAICRQIREGAGGRPAGRGAPREVPLAELYPTAIPTVVPTAAPAAPTPAPATVRPSRPDAGTAGTVDTADAADTADTADVAGNPVGGNSAGPKTAKEIYRRNIAGIVEIDCDFGDISTCGTGFFVSTGGYLVSNAHVVISRDGQGKLKLADRILISGASAGITTTGEVIFADPKNDLALMRVGISPTAALVPAATALEIGDKIYAIGNSRGEGLTLLDGIVGDLEREFNGHSVFLFNALVANGCSGGPIFNDRGEVCGATVGQIKDTPGMNYGIPYAVIADFLHRAEEAKGIAILD